MRTVCATSVLAGHEAFATLGEVTVLPDASISRKDLSDADILIVRSKTPVNESLLAGTRVSFVGTATAGVDHLDVAFLDAAEIAWSSAPGCNANSVAEYVVAALFHLSRRHGLNLEGRSLGVIGVGRVGRRVVELAGALGMVTLENDPPLQESTRDARYLPLAEVLPQADFVTLHTPLTSSGSHPTRHLGNRRFFEQLRPGACLINAARGEVLDSEALLEGLAHGVPRAAVLDVWENEPRIRPDLMRKLDLGTPHIAGYSWEGKLAGTAAVYRAACLFFEKEPSWDPHPAAGGHEPRIEVDAAGRTDEEVIGEIVGRSYDIAADDRELRAAMDRDEDTRANLFRDLRHHYRVRREFPAARLRIAGLRPSLQRKLTDLGFRPAHK